MTSAANIIQLHARSTPTAGESPMPARTTPPFALGITDEWCPPIGKSLLLLTIEYAKRDLQSSGSPFPFAVAVVALMLDVSSGKVLSQREYATTWGWTRQETRTRWDALKEAMLRYATAYGRLQGDDKITAFCANPVLTQSQPSANPKSDEIGEESANANPVLTQSQPSANPPLIKEQDNKEQITRNTNTPRPRAREGDGGKGGKREPKPLPTVDGIISQLTVPESLIGNTQFAELWRDWVAHRLTKKPPKDWVAALQKHLDYAAKWNIGYISDVIEQTISCGWDNFYPKRDHQEAYLAALGRTKSKPVAIDATTTAVTADAWWLMDYHRCLEEATKQGFSGQPKHWPMYKDADGKAYWVKPENVQRGIPATFTLHSKGE